MAGFAEFPQPRTGFPHFPPVSPPARTLPRLAAGSVVLPYQRWLIVMIESVTDTPTWLRRSSPLSRGPGSPALPCLALLCTAGSNQSHLAVFIQFAIFRRPSGGGRKAGIVEGRTLHHWVEWPGYPAGMADGPAEAECGFTGENFLWDLANISLGLFQPAFSAYIKQCSHSKELQQYLCIK